MYFNEAFEVEVPEQYDWFAPILEVDTLLFANPFLLFIDDDEKWSHAHDKLMDYFYLAGTRTSL